MSVPQFSPDAGKKKAIGVVNGTVREDILAL